MSNRCEHPSLKGAKMKTPLPDYLMKVMNECGDNGSGQTAQYIPELANANPDQIALCLSTVDGFVYGVGDVHTEFTIQSISKAFVYALAIEEHGLKYVLSRIGVEPSGEAFNELSLEESTRRPLNPMINAGAITCHTLIGPQDEDIGTDARFELVRKGLSAFAGRELTVDEKVYTSELDHAWRNVAIANMLRYYHVVKLNPNEVVRGYTRQCSVNVTAADLARMGATLANGGVQPVTGQRVVGPGVVKQVLSVMMTCGMYDAAGDWMTTVGMPAKSGVAGGLVGALPGQLGLATFSPRLDSHGNSVRGVNIFQRLSSDMGLHIMHAPEPARSVVRRHYILKSPTNAAGENKHAIVLSLQGTITFAAVERVLRVISQRSAEVEFGDHMANYILVLDVRQVHSVDKVARGMIREGVRRLRAAGSDVVVVDPDRVLDMVTELSEKERADIINHTSKHKSATFDKAGDELVAAEDNAPQQRRCEAVVDDLSMFKGWERTPPVRSMLQQPIKLQQTA